MKASLGIIILIILLNIVFVEAAQKRVDKNKKSLSATKKNKIKSKSVNTMIFSSNGLLEPGDCSSNDGSYCFMSLSSCPSCAPTTGTCQNGQCVSVGDN